MKKNHHEAREDKGKDSIHHEGHEDHEDKGKDSIHHEVHEEHEGKGKERLTMKRMKNTKFFKKNEVSFF